MSKTRQRFMERKRKRRETRAYDKWWNEHHFWCKGQRRRNGKLRECQFEVRFREAVEGAKATCSFCKTMHVYSSAGTGRSRWLSRADYGEVYIPEESLLRAEDVYREMDLERKVKGKHGVMETVPEKRVLISHAPWCHHPEVIIAGLTAKLGGPGRVRWRDAKGIIRHNCVSSEAGRKHGVISGQLRANTDG